MRPDADCTDALLAAVVSALETRMSLTIVGNGTKSFYGRPAPPGLATLELASHRGIVDYQPSELTLTARAGTPLREIEDLLTAHGQMLGFEPPYFGPAATLGGTVACGFSGPRRPFAGSLRDAVLGCRIINGKGEVLKFGGQVIKNVAGFDVSRLMSGALGTLGVLLDVSLRVHPRPEAETTLVLPMTAEAALNTMNRWCGQPWPISGLACDESWLYLRLAGTERALAAAREKLGGDPAVDGPGFWQRLKEHEGRFFQFPPLGRNLWRLSVPAAAPPDPLPGHWFYDWAGALRWLRTDAPDQAIFSATAKLGGHATLFRGASAEQRIFQPLPAPLKAVHVRVKRAFDPHGVFNPGRYCEDF